MALTLDGSSGMTAPQGAVYNGLQTGTAVTASGTSNLFTGIPIWAKRVVILFAGLSKSGSGAAIVQVGSGSLKTTGYTGQYGVFFGTSTPGAGNISTGFYYVTASGQATNGAMRLENISGNTWVASGVTGTTASGGPFTAMTTGYVTLTGALDRVSVTSVNGTDTFSGGTLNIIYE